MKFSRLQLSKETIAPWGAHGNIIEVGRNGVLDIETIPGTPHVAVTYLRKGNTERCAFKDWEKANIVVAEYHCENCGKELENAQALGKHRTTCGVERVMR